ncbi:MAG: hypothetical protein GY838_12540 [bacterium]|nr:hypothetical protein [bacterium]
MSTRCRLGWGICLTMVLAAGAEGSAPVGELAVADWEASLLSRSVRGVVAVLAGADGSLRWEIASVPDTALAALLARDGRGWTVIAAPGGRGTRNAWGQEWRALEPDLARILVAGTEAALAGSAGRRVVVVEPVGDLRSRLVERGRGRGGPGEILRLRPEVGGGAALVSSRRPGTVRVSSWRRHRVRFPARESFTPLWPLAELLEFITENGNPGD